MTGVEQIAAERKRQVEEEGWTPEHDDEHTSGELAMAAVCYATPEPVFVHREAESSFFSGNTGDRGDRRLMPEGYYDPWPWDELEDKRPYDPEKSEVTPNRDLRREQRIRQLVKAGALIAAEIDRLQREAGDKQS